MSNVAVIGGGISGLAAAHYLNKLNKGVIDKITLLEKSSDVGGWIKTSRFEDGTLLEQGPRSIRPVGESGQTTLELIESLGIERQILPVHLGHPSTKTRLILVNNKLYPLPTGIKTIFQRVPPFTKPLGLVAIKEFFTPKRQVDDESMYTFAQRRFGQQVADYAIDPLCRGVVAGDAREISVKTILKPFFDAEQKHGSIVKGMIKSYRESRNKLAPEGSHLVKKAKDEFWRMWNLEGGLQTLPEKLAKNVKEAGVELQRNTSCKSIKFIGDKAQITLSDRTLTVDHVFASLPAHSLKDVIVNHPELSNLLAEIPSVSVGLVNLEFKGNCLPTQGFGFLVPSNQKSDILGIIFDSCNFPQHNGKNQDKTRLSVMMGGRWFESLFGTPNKADNAFLLRTATTAVREHLGIALSPTKQEVFILEKCIPQYIVGHSKRLKNIRKYIEENKLPLTLIGSSYDGVSVNDCIHNSKKNVEKYLKSKIN